MQLRNKYVTFRIDLRKGLVGMVRSILYVENKVQYVLSHRLPLLQAVRDKGFEVSVATLIEGNGALIEEHGFTYYPVGSAERSSNPIEELRLIARLARLYREVQPDLTHHITLRCVLYGSIAARLAGVQTSIVNGVTGLGYLFSSDKMKVCVLKNVVLSILYLATRGMRPWWIFQNPDDQALFTRWDIPRDEKTQVILGSGVDMERFNTNGNGHSRSRGELPLIVFPARMLWTKGAGIFVKAAEALKQKGISVRMVLVGDRDPDNPESIPLSTLEAWNKEGAVEWWGYQGDMPAVFEQASIICLPSMYREGVPKVLIEAASCGCPIVTTDTPGCREIVRDDWNGHLVPPDDPEAVAEALTLLIQSTAQREEMGRNGRQLVQDQFSIERVLRSTLDLYGEALA